MIPLAARHPRGRVGVVAVEPLEVYHYQGRPEPRLERDDGRHAERVLARLVQELFDALPESIRRRMPRR